VEIDNLIDLLENNNLSASDTEIDDSDLYTERAAPDADLLNSLETAVDNPSTSFQFR
jgi:hypothetical protein